MTSSTVTRGAVERPHDRRRQAVLAAHSTAQTAPVVADLHVAEYEGGERHGRLGMGLAERHLEAGLARLGLQLGRGPVGDHEAVVHDDDPVGELVGLVEILGGQKHRRALADEAADDLPDPGAARWVEPRRRFVEEEHRWSRDETRGHVEAPAHAARILLEDTVGGVDELELLEELGGAPAGGGPGEPGKARRP